MTLPIHKFLLKSKTPIFKSHTPEDLNRINEIRSILRKDKVDPDQLVEAVEPKERDQKEELKEAYDQFVGKQL